MGTFFLPAAFALAMRLFAQPALRSKVLHAPGPPRTVRHLPEIKVGKGWGLGVGDAMGISHFSEDFTKLGVGTNPSRLS